MFSAATYSQRRNQLRKNLASGLALFLGNDEVGMNYAANTYHFRQDSNFLYFFGLDKPGLAAVIDLDEGGETIFGDDTSLDDVVWMGPQPTLSEQSAKVGIRQTAPSASLSALLKKAMEAGRTIHFLPPYRYANKFKLSEWLDIPVAALKSKASTDFIKAVIAQRAYKSAEEVVELHKAVSMSAAMHTTAIKSAVPGKPEFTLAGIVHGVALSLGGDLAYPIILSKDGQTLHNHYHGNILEDGDLVLGDFGAETPMHYAGDLTRTFPAGKKFSVLQKEVYNIVLNAQMAALNALKPGVTYKEIHLLAAKKMTEGLNEFELMKGDPDEAVAAGAHAMFFPHGLGHMLGLDVHDMEDLGEDFVGYSETVKRSDQFGTAYLRLGRELEPGFVLTVEPGLYFIPELIDMWRSEAKFKDFINYDKAEKFKQFGGIRIEDNVLITENGYELLGKPLAKTIAEIEAMKS